METEIVLNAEQTESEIELTAENITVISGGGTTDYNELENKPQINSITLIGNKSFEDLGADSLTNSDILQIINTLN